VSSSADAVRPRRGLARPARIGLLLAPALSVVGVLFVGGFALGVAQSLGYQPFLDGWRWSTDAYTTAWQDPAVRASVGLTLRVSLLSTVGATVLGVAAALLIHRTRRARRLLTAVFASPLPVPHIVGALTMLLLLSQSGLLSRVTHAVGVTGTPAEFPALTADGFGVAIIAEYVWKETPFVGVVVLAALSAGVDELEDAARTLGAGGLQRLRHVVLPLIAPSVAAPSGLVFAFPFGSYEVPFRLGGPVPAALPVVARQYHQDVALAARPEAMAISVVIAVLVGAQVVVYLATVDRLVRRVR
jgi:putative spermidine/putrescine transport system permease protein